MSDNTRKMQLEYLKDTVERLEELMVLGHDAIMEIQLVIEDLSLRLDVHKFETLSKVLRHMQGNAYAIQALRDLRKRDGEFHERA